MIYKIIYNHVDLMSYYLFMWHTEQDIQLGSTDHAKYKLASTVSFSIQCWNNLPAEDVIFKSSLHLTTLKFQLCSLVIITFYCGNMPQLWLWSNFSCTILVYQNYKLLNYDWTTSSSTVWIIAVAIKMANSETLLCISFTNSRCSSNNLLTCITSPQHKLMLEESVECTCIKCFS